MRKIILLGLLIILLSGCTGETSKVSRTVQKEDYYVDSKTHKIEYSINGYESALFGDTLVVSDIRRLKVIDLVKKDIIKTIKIPSKYGVMGFDINNNYIVWSDLRNYKGPEGDLENANTDIFLYDIKTENIKQITTDISAQSRPKIWRNYIIWADNRADRKREYPGEWQLYLYDINTGKEKVISSTLAAYATYAIDDYKVVWEDERNFKGDNILRGGGNIPENNKDIYLYDIRTNKEQPIATGPLMESLPSISKDTVVWEDRNTGHGYNADILMYSIVTGKKKKITNDKYNQGTPKIYGEYVVWMAKEEEFQQMM